MGLSSLVAIDDLMELYKIKISQGGTALVFEVSPRELINEHRGAYHSRSNKMLSTPVLMRHHASLPRQRYLYYYQDRRPVCTPRLCLSRASREVVCTPHDARDLSEVPLQPRLLEVAPTLLVDLQRQGPQDLRLSLASLCDQTSSQ